ncbi:hypothetical protein NIES23_41310 [Trichormus variabilis NIES-23]|uniref:Uncharacterized protein n=1 Tax=Trichormus variabilis NIES-23 TaxID=1973479 RepID=A0A1Z4KQR0_ANAVA|nr:hypothetical protein NIES23_41310 [Trichormus variabilis NIES-23]
MIALSLEILLGSIVITSAVGLLKTNDFLTNSDYRVIFIIN